jgi:two-component system cell cycle sensor histidine kinase/response regulator CckA
MEQMLNHLIGEDIKLIQRTADSGNLVEADQGQIEQILVNLVVNARDAIAGKGKIEVSTASQKVTGELNAIGRMVPAGDYVVLSVQDTGSGIPAEIQTKIFDPFFTTKEIGKGTGLGLATVISIVEQNRGYLTLQTEVGKGTTFSIYLPQIEVAAPLDVIEDDEADLPTGNEVILLVEDEDYIREFVADILEEHGYRVLQAEDGQDALDLIHETSPTIDLLFTDVRMPNIKGPELAERMLKIYPDLRVIFVSGYADDKRIREGIPSLQSDFVQKPFNVPTLITKVRTILDS